MNKQHVIINQLNFLVDGFNIMIVIEKVMQMLIIFNGNDMFFQDKFDCLVILWNVMKWKINIENWTYVYDNIHVTMWLSMTVWNVNESIECFHQVLFGTTNPEMLCMCREKFSCVFVFAHIDPPHACWYHFLENYLFVKMVFLQTLLDFDGFGFLQWQQITIDIKPDIEVSFMFSYQ